MQVKEIFQLKLKLESRWGIWHVGARIYSASNEITALRRNGNL